ncbi:Vmc-like lipoprotein signal peptide domain-containing protein [Spiroplasma endosymbiont of Glossina fuscipes fuscipes]|uniref:Vmc-like lipoprotein signal peptide domain-containing protein n=1 Tax=Spiroplasma endosymbiont of Glossina fuscipes fuscipes TaxID=2004463 RepID=UPI003C75C2BF
MKKLMIVLTSLALTAPIAGAVVACKDVNNKGGQTDGTFPTVSNIKAKLKQEGYNVDNLDVDLAPGMKTATIRFMPDAPNKPYLTKKMDLTWPTNDITKIITVTSMPYDAAMGKTLPAQTVLAAVNGLNGTKFTLNDVDVKVDQTSYNSTITPKAGGNFTGEAIAIVNEPITFSEAFPLTNIGDIYIAEELWNAYKSKPSDEGIRTKLTAAIMEFVGDRNRFAALYKGTMMAVMVDAMSNKGISLTINTNNGVGSLKIEASAAGVINKSVLTANFTIHSTPRKFLNTNDAKPTNGSTINVTLDKSYSAETVDNLRYDLVAKLLGQQFADQYKDIWYDEIWVIFKEDKSGATVNAKPGSKILAASDSLASLMTEIPSYTLNVTFS